MAFRKQKMVETDKREGENTGLLQPGVASKYLL
jgi:hypothetical protein